MDRTRHSQIFDASDLSVTLIGAGGIGAVTALTLAKMGVGILEIWDDDEVSPVNIPTQLHRLSDIGMNKAASLDDWLHDFSDDVEILPVAMRVRPKSDCGNALVISAVDSIASRKVIWEAVKDNFSVYIDARMGSQQAEIFCVQGSETAWYEELLAATDDSQFVEEPCTRKATFHCAMGIAGLIGSLVCKMAAKQDLPKFVSYDFRSFTGGKI